MILSKKLYFQKSWFAWQLLNEVQLLFFLLRDIWNKLINELFQCDYCIKHTILGSVVIFFIFLYPQICWWQNLQKKKASAKINTSTVIIFLFYTFYLMNSSNQGCDIFVDQTDFCFCCYDFIFNCSFTNFHFSVVSYKSSLLIQPY